MLGLVVPSSFFYAVLFHPHYSFSLSYQNAKGCVWKKPTLFLLNLYKTPDIVYCAKSSGKELVS